MRPIALTSSHIEEFWALRSALLSELGELPGGGEAQTFEEASRVYFLSHIGRDLFCWGIPAEDGLAACGSLCLFERLPYPGNVRELKNFVERTILVSQQPHLTEVDFKN